MVSGWSMQVAVAHHQEAGIIGHLPPFVEVERDGIGPFEPAQQRCDPGCENAERAIGAVDMKPEPLFAA